MSTFMKGWRLSPDLAENHSQDLEKALTSFECTADRGVGAPIMANSPKSISYWDVTNDVLLVDPGTWAQSGGRPLVLAKGPSNTGEQNLLWIDRGELVDPIYATTLQAIDEMAAAYEPEVQATFLLQQKADIEARNKVSLPNDAQGVVEGDKRVVVVPKGDYEKLQVKGEGSEDGTPFEILISVPGIGPVAVTLAALLGADTSDSEKARAAHVAVTVPAATIMKTFAESPVIGHYVPDKVWLTDQHIHYVTRDQMGAAHVLRKLPSGPKEIARAKIRDNKTFVSESFVPGLRLEDDILVQLTHLGTGVEYHEALHLLSHRTFREMLGRSLNEGVTEYFTRLAIAGLAGQNELVRTDSPYEEQRSVAETLVNLLVVTDAQLGEAYFQGNLDPLYSGFHRATGGRLNLAAFAERLAPPNASFAEVVLGEAVAEHHKAST